MRIGYVVDLFQEIKGKIPEDSGIFEDFCRQHGYDFELLDFNEAIISLQEQIPAMMRISEVRKDLSVFKQELKEMGDKLKENGIEAIGPMLAEDPQWTRHGEPINYGNYGD